MATVNNRSGIVQAVVFNGVDAGGAMSAHITAGYDEIIETEPDGLEVPISDRGTQFVRGVLVSQDWLHIIDLLTGTVGTYVAWERKSGVAAATGYIQHTLTNPVIHNVRIDFTKGQYGTITAEFECRAADETKTIADMWGMLDDQAAPTYVSAARGGWRLHSASLNPFVTPVTIHHITAFSFGIKLDLVKACNDSDIAYTCVDARLDGARPTGSITFQDGEIDTAQLLAQRLVLHARAPLGLTVKQSAGGTDQKIIISGVCFDSAASNSGAANPKFSDYTLPFRATSDATAPLTLSGVDPIISIENA